MFNSFIPGAAQTKKEEKIAKSEIQNEGNAKRNVADNVCSLFL
jgi:hypothetical protein